MDNGYILPVERWIQALCDYEPQPVAEDNSCSGEFRYTAEEYRALSPMHRTALNYMGIIVGVGNGQLDDQGLNDFCQLWEPVKGRPVPYVDDSILQSVREKFSVPLMAATRMTEVMCQHVGHPVDLYIIIDASVDDDTTLCVLDGEVCVLLQHRTVWTMQASNLRELAEYVMDWMIHMLRSLELKRSGLDSCAALEPLMRAK